MTLTFAIYSRMWEKPFYHLVGENIPVMCSHRAYALFGIVATDPLDTTPYFCKDTIVRRVYENFL